MKIVAAVFATLAVLAGLFLAFLFSGVYSVAASTPHSRPVRWMFATLMENSIRVRANRIKSPPPPDPAAPAEGFRHFDAMCVACHGAPGLSRSEAGKGLNPQPPRLEEAVRTRSPAELYWVIRHGIRMTGMPAFGATHNNPELWAIVAFVRRLPEMSPAEYADLRRSARGKRGGRSGNHDDDHHH